MQHEPLILSRDGGATIAYREMTGKSPTVIYCGGYHSDMTGSKAVALSTWCCDFGHAYIRFDYQGHGVSSGEFTDGSIGLWRDDALSILDQTTTGPIVLVGSSMGAWIALLIALKRPDRISGMVLLAPAVDFTIELMWNKFDTDIRDEIENKGFWNRPSEFENEAYPITLKLIEESRAHLLLDAPIAFPGPVQILYGLADDVVPLDHVMRTVEAIASSALTVTLVKGGDHRLSQDTDIARMRHAVGDVISQTTKGPAARHDSSDT